MEPVRNPNETEVGEELEVLPRPGLEEFLTSEVVLDLLKMPKDGLIRINAALFFLGSDEMFAFYWRDTHNGQQHCKLLQASAVRTAFHQMPMDSGFLPSGTLRFGCDATGTRWLSIFIPPARCPLSIIDNDLGTVLVAVPLPGFIFTGCGRNYWIWTVKDAQITPETPLYHAPLSNVGASGSICFGANRPPEADGSTIQEAFHLFLDSPFNGHLANNKSRKYQGDVRYLLQELGSQKAFPYDDLFPLATKEHPTKALTLDILLKHIINPRR